MGNINHFDLTKFNNIKLFVETGTGAAFSTGALLAAFGRGYTIEIEPRLAEAAKKALPATVEVVCGDSQTALDKICAEELEPILFWLDAHYPMGDTNHLPLEEELKIIAKRNNPEDVILIDDARIYFDMDFEAGRLPAGYASGTIDFAKMFPCYKMEISTDNEGYITLVYDEELAAANAKPVPEPKPVAKPVAKPIKEAAKVVSTVSATLKKG